MCNCWVRLFAWKCKIWKVVLLWKLYRSFDLEISLLYILRISEMPSDVSSLRLRFSGEFADSSTLSWTMEGCSWVNRKQSFVIPSSTVPPSDEQPPHRLRIWTKSFTFLMLAKRSKGQQRPPPNRRQPPDFWEKRFSDKKYSRAVKFGSIRQTPEGTAADRIKPLDTVASIANYTMNL